MLSMKCYCHNIDNIRCIDLSNICLHQSSWAGSCYGFCSRRLDGLHIVYCRIGIYRVTKISRKADFSFFRVYFISRVSVFYSAIY